jgi:hypothetical protein
MGLIAAYGFLFRKGDFLALLRKGIHELYFDNIQSLSTAVHNSILEAAEQIGLDTDQLQTRNAYFNGDRR